MHTAPGFPRHLSFAVGLLIALLAAYGLLVLYPAYASGLSASADPTEGDVIVPLYADRPIDPLFGAVPAFPPTFAVGFLALFWCGLPLCSLAILTVILVPAKLTTGVRWRHLTLLLLICWSIILITLPAANAFVLWLLD
jgi:hypothetical protein